MISRTTGMTTDVDNYMFGSVLAMTKGDVALSVVLSVTVLCNLRCRLWRDAIANGTYRSLPRYVPSDK